MEEFIAKRVKICEFFGLEVGNPKIIYTFAPQTT